MNLRNALRSLKESWQRSVLSGLGIMVASVAILLLISIGKGVEKDVTRQVDDIGANVLVCVPGRVDLQTMGFNPNLGGQSWFKESHRDLVRKVPGVKETALFSFAGGGLRVGKKEAYPLMIATTPEWFSIHKASLKAGRVFGSTKEREVVLGAVARQLLFGDGDALGRDVQINGDTFRVVGLLSDEKDQSLFSMQSFQNVAYIPYEAQKQISPSLQIDRIVVECSSTTEPKALVKNIEAALGSVLDRQQYSILTQEDLLGLIFSVMSILSTLVVGLTSIALFVGAVGIFAVMVLSVNERRKEIGVLKAIGAKRSDIFGQILAESAIIGVGGVLTGLALSTVVNAFLAAFTKIKPLMTLETVLIAFAVGVGVGALAGLIPAMQAARQDPVVALRSE